MEIKGGCLCGAVRYTAEVDPTSATVCHCRDCQKFTGSAFAALVRATKEAVNIEGTLKTFSSLGGSGNPILRHFCPECGSSIAEEPGTRPGVIILNVGTFDQPAAAKPGREIFRETRCRGSRCTAKYRASENAQIKNQGGSSISLAALLLSVVTDM
jgi:hypothetical protein